MGKISFAFLLFLFFLKCSAATNITSSTDDHHKLNKECVGDIIGAVILQFHLYQTTCPEAEAIIFAWVNNAVAEEPRMAASLLRLHFHDCFVNGCDASVLLDDNANFVGEKTAPPNFNSLRGFEVIDRIKYDIELVCPGIVSCADILAIAARDSVVLSGGPSWEVELGRRDGLTASKAAALNSIPAPNSTVAILVNKFQNVGLSLTDVVALSGAHTMGKARCTTFGSRLQADATGNPPQDINLDFIQSLQQFCSGPDGTESLAHLDLVTPATFDNQYFINLLSGEGLLQSDQALAIEDEQTRSLVQMYAEDPFAFSEDFKTSMLRMGKIGVLTGSSGEIRTNCRAVN